MDGIYSQVLNLCADEMSKPLFIIYKKSLEEGRLPKEWIYARVVPIYNKGSKKHQGNYRAVSLTLTPCKIIESIIIKSILEHVEDLDLLSREQLGFMKGISCLTNLLETFEEVTRMMVEGEGVDIIYLDYSKAFDSVPHKRLLSKWSPTESMRRYGNG